VEILRCCILVYLIVGLVAISLILNRNINGCQSIKLNGCQSIKLSPLNLAILGDFERIFSPKVGG